MYFHYLFSHNFLWVIITHTQSQQLPSQYASLQNNYSFSENDLPYLHLCRQFEFPFQINWNIFHYSLFPSLYPLRTLNLKIFKHSENTVSFFCKFFLESHKKFQQWLPKRRSHTNLLSPPKITSSRNWLRTATSLTLSKSDPCSRRRKQMENFGSWWWKCSCTRKKTYWNHSPSCPPYDFTVSICLTNTPNATYPKLLQIYRCCHYFKWGRGKKHHHQWSFVYF